MSEQIGRIWGRLDGMEKIQDSHARAIIEITVNTDKKLEMINEKMEERFSKVYNRFDDVSTLVSGIAGQVNSAKGAAWGVGKTCAAFAAIFSLVGSLYVVMHHLENNPPYVYLQQVPAQEQRK